MIYIFEREGKLYWTREGKLLERKEDDKEEENDKDRVTNKKKTQLENALSIGHICSFLPSLLLPYKNY